MKNKKRIFIAGGGTGGHVFPGISIIEKLKETNKDIDFFWLGKKNSIEDEIIKKYKYINFISVPSGKLRRYFSLKNFTDIFRVFFGIIKSFFILNKYKPKILYSTGGFVSTPPIIAASFLKIKTITHEMDLDPGLANKINSKFANKIHISFEESKNYFKNKNVVYTGTPIRTEFLNPKIEIIKKITKNTNKPVISILGGSLGAETLNNMALKIKKILKNIYFIHQSGKSLENLREDNYFRSQFFKTEEMVSIINFSNIIISRAGASSIKEFASAGACVIFIPFKKGSRGDQIRNAKMLLNKEACLYIDEDELKNINNIIDIINGLLINKEKVNKIKNNIKKFSNINSSELIAKMLLKDIKEIK